ncbi:unnamed protein product [Rotaria sordida]|uniref:C-type lectin domain-containing protein n=1 Tax=Rotaria sordida TaxID=392033 RepID=A0A814R8K6_9BILA|nr:unnamed protein product [Rotaria sordida]CAF1128690.1 unnamed protein product [Rotaria sordida]CAF1160098.1 unnamed protein product [Rotaria sordida]CAF1281711.1 unnamed protein product [Rotaria sordida]CAF1282502.1 unnamed protein product [Rotaria sordida]
MINKLQQRITSFYYLFILIIFLLTIQPIFSNKIVDLIYTIRNKTTDDSRLKNNLVSEFHDILQAIQDHLYNTSISVCLPGFQFYGGSCYLLSSNKSTWLSASKSCLKIRNSTLVTFETYDELDFVVENLLKPLRINQAFIGLNASDIGQWYWLDGRTFWDSMFGPLFYVYRPETSHCGLINLVNRTKVAIEGRDCFNDEARFICKYVQNHCYQKHVCGRGGECMNIGLTYRCRCNFLYRGRKCDQLSSKAIQSIIALIIIILMVLIVCCLKFDICLQCKSKKKCHSIDDLFNENQMILEGHKKKKSMINY